MVSILICSTNSNNYKKPAYDNGFYAKSHFVDNVCCSITNNETSRNCSISAPVRLTSRAKLLSQMNPIAGSMSADSRSVEIQARRSSERPGYRAGFQLRCKRILIHLVFGELGQHSISLLFLFEALMQKSLVIAQVQLTGQSCS